MRPIFNHREIVGYAKTIKQAKGVIKRTLQTGHIPKGWDLIVKERDTSIIDLPAGFVYTISYKY